MTFKKKKKKYTFNCHRVLNPAKVIHINYDFCYHKLIIMIEQETYIKGSQLYELKWPSSEMLHLYNPRLFLLQES